MNDTVNSLAHTSWNCKYHIVFAPKYRRQVFYKSKRLEIGQILRKLCEFKGVELKYLKQKFVLITFICWSRYHQRYQFQDLLDI